MHTKCDLCYFLNNFRIFCEIIFLKNHYLEFIIILETLKQYAKKHLHISKVDTKIY